jgi:hypothetical protein
VKLNVNAAVAACLIEFGEPVSVAEVAEALPEYCLASVQTAVSRLVGTKAIGMRRGRPPKYFVVLPALAGKIAAGETIVACRSTGQGPPRGTDPGKHYDFGPLLAALDAPRDPHRV